MVFFLPVPVACAELGGPVSAAGRMGQLMLRDNQGQRLIILTPGPRLMRVGGTRGGHYLGHCQLPWQRERMLQSKAQAFQTLTQKQHSHFHPKKCLRSRRQENAILSHAWWEKNTQIFGASPEDHHHQLCVSVVPTAWLLTARDSPVPGAPQCLGLLNARSPH